jgi:hypothetical protein
MNGNELNSIYTFNDPSPDILRGVLPMTVHHGRSRHIAGIMGNRALKSRRGGRARMSCGAVARPALD